MIVLRCDPATDGPRATIMSPGPAAATWPFVQYRLRGPPVIMGQHARCRPKARWTNEVAPG